jgi:hypothetical protein
MSDPWMKFYYVDFLARTAMISSEEVGALVDLMAWCHATERPFKPQLKGVSRLLGCPPAKAQNLLGSLVARGLIQWDGDELWVPMLDEWRIRDSRERVIPREISDAVKRRDGSKCAYCGDTEGPFDLDHILPWSRGGQHSAENLTVACATCNRSKGAKTPEEWRQ